MSTRGRKRTWRFKLGEDTVLEVSAPRRATEMQVRRRGRVSLVLMTLAAAAILVGVAGGAVWTDQQDYSPGSVVTISGDNSNGAGYLPGETVSVDVSGPNGYSSSCEATANVNGAWSCQVTLWDSPDAVGNYSYTATSTDVNGDPISESGTFTDALNTKSFESTCTTETDSFTTGSTVCIKLTGLGNGASGTIKWWKPSLDPSTDTPTQDTPYSNANGNATDTLQVSDCGIWHVVVTASAVTGGTPDYDDTFEVTGCTTNQAPVIDSLGTFSGTEGSPVSLTGTAHDPDGDPITYSWNIDATSGDSGISCLITDASNTDAAASVTCNDDSDNAPGTFDVAFSVSDDQGHTTTQHTTLDVANEDPDIGTVTPLDGSVYAVNTNVNLSAVFSDVGTNDEHFCNIDWGDSTLDTRLPSSGFFARGTTSCGAASHSYTEANLYWVTITVADDDGGTDTKSIMLVIYDPSAGFVTGGGWIDSPAGAYYADPSLSGKAIFGFVSKYKKGASVPDGNTEFQFLAAGFNFKSTAYQWLVVNGKNKAQYKGSGTVNGSLAPTGDPYTFLVTLYDGGNSGDKFRIKVWYTDGTDVLVYDSGTLAANGLDDGLTAISGGSIVIHTGK